MLTIGAPRMAQLVVSTRWPHCCPPTGQGWPHHLNLLGIDRLPLCQCRGHEDGYDIVRVFQAYFPCAGRYAHDLTLVASMELQQLTDPITVAEVGR